MTDSQKQFAETLLAAAPRHADARQRYDMEMTAMFKKSLGPRERGGYLIGALLALTFAGLFAMTMLGAPPQDMPVYPFVLGFFLLNAILLLALSLLLFHAFWNGTINPRSSQSWATTLGVTYLALIGWSLMNAASLVPDSLRAETRIFGLVVMLYAAVAWVRHRIALAEDRTAEKLLEIELRLAELAERK